MMAESCCIRAVTREDLPMILAWRNHPDIRGVTLARHEITPREQRARFERATSDANRWPQTVDAKQP